LPGEWSREGGELGGEKLGEVTSESRYYKGRRSKNRKEKKQGKAQGVLKGETNQVSGPELTNTFAGEGNERTAGISKGEGVAQKRKTTKTVISSNSNKTPQGKKHRRRPWLKDRTRRIKRRG